MELEEVETIKKEDDNQTCYYLAPPTILIILLAVIVILFSIIRVDMFGIIFTIFIYAAFAFATQVLYTQGHRTIAWIIATIPWLLGLISVWSLFPLFPQFTLAFMMLMIVIFGTLTLISIRLAEIQPYCPTD